jgi:hypothetical protein
MGGAFLGRGNRELCFRGMRHDLRESFPLSLGARGETNSSARTGTPWLAKCGMDIIAIFVGNSSHLPAIAAFWAMKP